METPLLLQLVSNDKTLNDAHEVRFIQDILLGGLPPQIKNHNPTLVGNPIVYLELFNPDIHFIDQVHSSGKKIALIHMGDIFAKKDISAYQKCDLILRCHYFPHIYEDPNLKNKILWIPHGYKTGVGPRNPDQILSIDRRTQFASFLGWIQNPDSFARERDSFLRMIRDVRKNPGERSNRFSKWFDRKRFRNNERRSFSKATFSCEDLYILSSSGFSAGKNVGLYSAILENSIFAPCPAGNSPETIRLYDVLECGAIPISLNHTFLTSPHALGEIGPVPFPILSSWDELPEFLRIMKADLHSNPNKIREMQKSCITWWSNYKSFITQKIHSALRNLVN